MKKMNYSSMGLQALRRAAIKAAENARQNKLKIPIWKNGKIEYIIPEKIPNKKTVKI